MLTRMIIVTQLLAHNNINDNDDDDDDSESGNACWMVGVIRLRAGVASTQCVLSSTFSRS